MTKYAYKKVKQRLGWCAVPRCRRRGGFIGTVRGYDDNDLPTGPPITVRWCGDHMESAFESLAPVADEITATVLRQERLK